jgi:hypothetical protein
MELISVAHEFMTKHSEIIFLYHSWSNSNIIQQIIAYEVDLVLSQAHAVHGRCVRE